MKFLRLLNLLLVFRGTMSQSNSFASLLFSSIEMSIVVIISWSILIENYWLFVKKFCICLVTPHVFEESNVILNLALRICNVVRLANIWKLIHFTVVVLEPNFILLRRINTVSIVRSRSRSCFIMLLFGFCLLTYLNL